MSIFDTIWGSAYNLIILGVGVYTFLFSLANIAFLYKKSRRPNLTTGPKVSVLIPARNEESNIGTCLRSLRSQNYDDYEILVLDDNSTDSTWDIILSCARKDPHIRALSGSELPDGWNGKNHALQQLIEEADGQFYLLTDADTIHAPDSLSFAVTNMEYHQVDMLTGYPRQLFPSISTQAVVSAMILPLMFLTPLWMLNRFQHPALSLAVGQYICLRAEAVHEIGGFTAIPDSITDDIHLARLLLSRGYRQIFLDVGDAVSCRMYSSFVESFSGISRSIIDYLGTNVLIPSLAIPMVLLVLVLPLPLLLFQLFSGMAISMMFIMGLMMMNASWITVTLFLRYSIKTCVLFTPTMMLILLMGTMGLFSAITGRGYRWKERIVR
jgi:chlorobactene glucosyltransferase